MLSDEALIWYKISSLNKAFSDHNYSKLDKYLSDTKFIYKDKTISYSEVRTNIQNALKDNKVVIGEHSFYCDTISAKLFTADCSIIGWILTKENSNDKMNDLELDIDVKLQRSWFGGWNISEFKSGDDLFKNIFIEKSKR